MSNLAIIPARGGSKRIPKKNLKPFCGKPIIFYSIEAAKKSQLFDEIMVSTDDEEIAEFALNQGVEVPFLRTNETSDDYATTKSVIDEVYNNYLKNGMVFNNICCIYPTAPLLSVADLINGYNTLLDSDYKLIMPVVKYGHPIWRGFNLESGQLKYIWPENVNRRTQDMKPTYHDAGQWYWLRTEILEQDSLTNGSNIGCVVIEESRVQDIDEYEDWIIAELKYRNILNK